MHPKRSRPRVDLVQMDADGYRVNYHFRPSPDLDPLLWDSRVLRLECSEGIRYEPEALAAGFVSAFAPLGWILGADIRSPYPIPAGALASLRRAGRHVQRHYGWPTTDPFRSVPAVEDNAPPKNHRALLFSGGVDSSFALLELSGRGSFRHAAVRRSPSRPAVDWLVNFSNFENLDEQTTPFQRRRAVQAVNELATTWGLGFLHLWTNMADVFNHRRFDDAFPEECSFWLGLQHVHHLVTAISVVRPLLQQVVLSGGFSELLTRVGSCAATSAYVASYNYPADFQLIHEFERRQHKTQELLDRAPDLVRRLRVCYSSGDGTCAECRKCQATALMIVAGGGSLRETSFPLRAAEKLLKRIRRYEIPDHPPEAYRFYNQALEGRALSGGRRQRWNQLIRLLEQEAAAAADLRNGTPAGTCPGKGAGVGDDHDG